MLDPDSLNAASVNTERFIILLLYLSWKPLKSNRTSLKVHMQINIPCTCWQCCSCRVEMVANPKDL